MRQRKSANLRAKKIFAIAIDAWIVGLKANSPIFELSKALTLTLSW
ncbi:MAG: hypothetical protein RMX68_022920 [Aulosira sp. ZfuVER01]|nr:hypothetical protein [Aulosira sp. DedVER01a]